MPGPLDGVRVIELAGIGPVPFAGMVLADLGAEVVRIERPDSTYPFPLDKDPTARSCRSIGIDLKQEGGVEVVLDLVASSDVLIEGLRPGVTERLGVGPDRCLSRNPALVYGRMTGWGQSGPLSGIAGHDINYLAISGTLSAIGPPQRPTPPLNLVADYGGGALLLVAGVLGALVHAGRTGEGQVVDAAMVDGSALLAAIIRGWISAGIWQELRESNLLDGAAPFYRTYRTSDGGFVAVGALEPQFYSALLAGLELDPKELPAQSDRSGWPVLHALFAEAFESKPRSHWESTFDGTDACVTPVLSFTEALGHPHNRARHTFIDVAGVMQPAPAPRFSATPPGPPRGPVPVGADTDGILEELGYSRHHIGMLRRTGAVSGAFRED